MGGSFWSDFRRRFSRGLAAILPTALTLALIIWLFQTINQYLGAHISRGAYWLARGFYPAEGVENAWERYHLDTAGFILAIVLVYVVGLFAASFIGRAIWRSIEGVLIRIPLVRQIFPSIKQITDFVLSERKVEFSRVVAVEYPRKGIWSVGFVTSGGLPRLREIAGEEVLTVFIPSSPTPITGYTITVRRSEVVDLPLTIDEAFRFAVSAGVVLPEMAAPPAGGLGPDAPTSPQTGLAEADPRALGRVITREERGEL